jgi:hypothetical protein
MDDEDPKSEVLEDDFETIKTKLKPPTPESSVKAKVDAQSEDEVVLWIGKSSDWADKIIRNRSAGGESPIAETQRPTKEQADTQVSKGNRYPEYATTTDSSWSARGWLIVAGIKAKYLTKGSGSESGWVALHSAPITIYDTVDRRILLQGQAELAKKANAS